MSVANQSKIKLSSCFNFFELLNLIKSAFLHESYLWELVGGLAASRVRLLKRRGSKPAFSRQVASLQLKIVQLKIKNETSS